MSWTVAVGVDTHKDSHTASAFDCHGVPLARTQVETSGDGYARLLAWAGALGVPAFAIEGTASYGAGLVAALVETPYLVYEVERPDRRERRNGKSDPLDADRAAKKLLAGEGLSVPRGGGKRELLRVLLVERAGARKALSDAGNQLHALRVTAPESLRERLTGRNATQLARSCLRLRIRVRDVDYATTIAALRRTSARMSHLADELDQIDDEIASLVRELAPELLEEKGIGPVTAAQLLVSIGDPRRLRKGEASLAKLAGTCPLPASSGQTVRHRLNRSGDRQLNRALHTIALTRIRFHEQTRAYYQRLLERGKTKREAIRCVKRALSRRLYRILINNKKLAYATSRQP
jgi:transposase